MNKRAGPNKGVQGGSLVKIKYIYAVKGFGVFVCSKVTDLQPIFTD